jgi:hypothetical protein
MVDPMEGSGVDSVSEPEATASIEDESISEPEATASVEDLRLIIASQKAEIFELKREVIVRSRTIRHLKKRVDANDPETTHPAEPADETNTPCSPAVKSGRKKPKSQNAGFQEKVARMLDEFVTTLGWKRKRVGRELALLVFAYDDAVCLKAIIKRSKAWLRTNVFTCYNILREMDRAGGTLGYEGMEIRRSVETKKVKWCKGSVIPSIAEFKRTAKKVEQLAYVLAPFALGRTGAGDKECIDFQPHWKIMGTVFRAHGSLGAGRLKSLLCVFSLDGAKITKNLGHTMAGMNMVDSVGLMCLS